MAQPRYAGISTFALLPYERAATVDVGVIGIPFDSGCTFRTGARFGPSAIRNASRQLRAYNPEQRVYPFASQTVADLGDIVCTPFNNRRAMGQIDRALRGLLSHVRRAPVVLGGDHSVSYAVLRALRATSAAAPPRGLALLHFDSHMDTFDSYYGESVTHGTPFRRAVEEGLVDPRRSLHIGVHGSVNDADEIQQDRALGFRTLRCGEIVERGIRAIVRDIRRRVGRTPCYVSIDVDVVDPGGAPGTGTPESGGLTAQQLLTIVQGLRGVRMVGGDVVELAPPYDVADVTATLAATLAYELVCLAAPSSDRGAGK
jgi:agmatinase